MLLKIFDVEHGACAMAQPFDAGPLAMVDCGDNTTKGWAPSGFIRNQLGRTRIDYLFVSNADQDHISDLDGIVSSGIAIGTLIRNPTPSAAVLRAIKEAGGPLTSDMERYLELHGGYNVPAPVPFDQGMGGVTCSLFYNQFLDFYDTNNLSLVVFLRYAGFKILFPGDIEVAGWQKLLKNPFFIAELRNTDVLVASHHGRDSGLCTDIFDYFTPQAVVISDDGVQYGSQETVTDYSYYVSANGIAVAGESRRRHVLTTRRDGNIFFQVQPDGTFFVHRRHG